MSEQDIADAASPGIDPNDIFRLLAKFDVQVCPDLHMLSLLALTIEVRNDSWKNKTIDALQLALQMNRNAGDRIDMRQLVAATLAHDFAMAFLPLDMLNKSVKLNHKGLKLMRTHISTAADLIHRMRGWEDARAMILGHHEHHDGGGYPAGLSGFEIAEGAKLLAIVDTYVARSSNTMQAIMEINRHSGDQFAPDWVEHFNAAIKVIHDH